MHGGVRFDEHAQVPYATDGSIYQARPADVVIPTSAADVRAAAGRGVGADVCGRLRYGADYQSVEPRTALDLEDEGGVLTPRRAVCRL